jgi:hypothetical protein
MNYWYSLKLNDTVQLLLQTALSQQMSPVKGTSTPLSIILPLTKDVYFDVTTTGDCMDTHVSLFVKQTLDLVWLSGLRL